ncbi:cytochrome P450 family protein [Amycolatopsis sp. VC5-11]|uniref:cytochrome P450 family protein n=1 Tax=Amycolatopsis sp. VC5-11 TaxID=3120156 RepID=UPI00300964CB
MTASELSAMEPFLPDFQLDPYPALKRIRDAGGIAKVPHPLLDEIWLVTSYDLVRSVLTDPLWVKPLDDDEVASFDSAPPDHTRLRGLVGKAFTGRRVEAARAWAERVTAQRLAELAARDSVDLVSEFADLMPVEVICHLCGIPRDRAAELGAQMLTFLDFENLEQHEQTFAAAEGYVAELIAAKRADPGDDLVSDLIRARDGGDRLSEAELVRILMVLLSNGAVTTTNVIGTGVHHLLENPDQLDLLRNRPDLIGSAVEEMLRFETPLSGIAWLATADTELGGVRIAEGEHVGVSLQGANRDPKCFPDPDRFLVTRSPNPHLCFSHGIHHCLGAALARMELQAAIGTLVRDWPDLRRAGTAAWRGGFAIRGLVELPVCLGGKP